MNAHRSRVRRQRAMIQPAAACSSPPTAPWHRVHLALAELRMAGEQALAEIRRLNRAGIDPEVLAVCPRGERTRLVKAALAERHTHGPARCC